LNLLIVFHSLYSLAGGVDNRLSELEMNLPSHINREYLLFKDEVDLPHKGRINILKSISIPKFILNEKRKFKYLTYLFGIFNLILRVLKTRKFLKEKKFDTILAVDDYFSIICLIASIGLNIKIVCSVRNNWDSLYDNSMIHLLPDFFYKKLLPILMNKYSSSVHCVSEELSEKLNKKYKVKNTKAIYNIFDIEIIKQKANEDIDIEGNYFINIGHFNKQKNQKDLIVAYKNLKENHNIPEKLILIGDGANIIDCKNLVKDFNLEKDVIFLGKQSNPYKYLKRASLYISSSLYEGLPAVFIESLILEIPIVSYEFETGSRELTSNLCSLTPDSLVNQMVYFISHKNLIHESISKGNEIVKNKFEKEVILNKWLELL
jgi:glycosyltransferase involved in cell wall biosynthesis